MPPCSKVLRQKIKLTSFVATKWFSSTEPFQPQLSPVDYGWKFEDGKYKINWFDGEIIGYSVQ